MKKQKASQTAYAELFRHKCEECSAEGSRGYGDFRQPKQMRWYCFKHDPQRKTE